MLPRLMLPRLMLPRLMLPRLMLPRLMLAGLMLAAAASAAQAADMPSAWVEFGADGALSVRTVIASGTACPALTTDAGTIAMTPRGMPNAAFPVQVCEASAPLTATRLAIGATALPVLPKTVQRIAVIGDTGCRIEGKAAQNCNDPAGWPFPAIANGAAGKHPDLVIHVGDYYYRENACPAGKTGCANSPFGDKWPTWQAEFFGPASGLLAAAPWVVIRGNHESCKRGGAGWVRLLDPHPATASCTERTEPYRVSAGGLELLPFDDADADDFLAPPGKVTAYAAQLAALLAAAPAHAWLVMHRPVWAMAQGKLNSLSINMTMQQAIKGHVPDNLDMVLSGHLHDFLSYSFGPEHPTQLVVGTGGDTLLPLGRDPVVGATIDGMSVRKGFAAERFGYFIMDRTAAGWDGVLYAPDDTVLGRCKLAGRDVDCQ